MFLCCPISAVSGSHFLLATNHSAFILTVFRRCEGNRQYRIILSADTASEVRQMPERCLSRKAGIMRCCLSFLRISGILFGGFGAACASYSRGLSVSLGSAGSFYFASGWFGRGNILDFWWVGMMAWDGFLCRVVGRNFPLRIIISHTSTP